ncbi:MAG: Asp-tRNA(Asn)/Glu-tRNA(Gln) amidotransferase GatCAB subunit C [Deltaproteobacteria bacterium]|nr:MAG: Asp-tRNA(Asn)/Glu-tRNA(Gln) amidotransferase GatCAB subunit C [Deltaproteobacteria bacterium]
MKISIQQVEYVARLARLRLSPQEKELFTGQLNAILQYMDKLNELDTSGVEPTFHVVSHVNAMREDHCKGSTPRDEVLKNAPSSQEGFFKVPRVI